jgi:hypothetical protein
MRAYMKAGAYTLLLALVLGAGCGSRQPLYHINPEIDLSYVKRVVVLPFENLTDEKYAGDIVRQIVTSELLASGLVDVVVPGETKGIMSSLGVKNITALTAEEFREVGKKLKVQGIVFGSVEKFGLSQLGGATAPEVTITIMMAESSSGIIAWSVTRTRVGANFLARHFGARAETLSETALDVVRDAVETLYEY